ncbi:hypothetical protein QR680_003590 [Steinernema hermaphroditum]|uniref:BTB domain-containing protein n=1 Tax=Steinernema hermaphroditum TaxID=289476 RepID=A0AA39HKX0_9BILA|nr:hypothetical protein QR680_003590 [Steinernema hermaphroditum]
MDHQKPSTSSPYDWIPLRRRENDFSRRTSLTDYLLIVEGERFFVNIGFLAQHSPFFKDLHINALDMDVYELENVKFEEFHEFLLFLYPNRKPIEATNIDILMRLAHRFQTIEIVNEVSGFILRTASRSDADLVECVRMADRHHLKHVVLIIVGNIQDPQILMNLRKIKDLSLSTKYDVYRRLRALEDEDEDEPKTRINDAEASKPKKSRFN